MLWAGILLIWELVGVDLEKAKDAEGNVGAIVKSIKSSANGDLSGAFPCRSSLSLGTL